MDRVERRSTLLATIRQYFLEQGVLEVVTPSIRPWGVTDPHLRNVAVDGHGYLQTSPEYAMKILLAESGRSIYQVCPAFRAGESGKRHTVEFQMLEWYRCGYSLVDLMDDVTRLLVAIGCSSPARTSYRQLFEAAYGVNPHEADDEQLLLMAREKGGAGHLDEASSRADALDLLFSRIETSLEKPVLVSDYPACQAALAQVSTNREGDEVSQRFEVYAAGIELGNAYLELNDSDTLRSRFKANNLERVRLGLPKMELDEQFLTVVDSVPDCAGIAIGIDRLLMVLAGVNDISLV